MSLFPFLAGYMIAEIARTWPFRRLLHAPKEIGWKLVWIVFHLYTLYIVSWVCYTDNAIGMNDQLLGSNLGWRIPAIIIISIASINPMFQYLLTNSVFGFLGRISFGVYLVHGVNLSLMMHVVIYFRDQGFEAFDSALLAELFFYLPMNILVGYLVYILFDKPSVKMIAQVYHVLFVVGLFASLESGLDYLDELFLVRWLGFASYLPVKMKESQDQEHETLIPVYYFRPTDPEKVSLS
jgi:peptidoglycan/LPS O-acetylase OafA/YrhL